MAPHEHWQQVSAHREYWECHNNPYVYEYDPTDDGPEARVATWIRSTHTRSELEIERYHTLMVEIVRWHFEWLADEGLL